VNLQHRRSSWRRA